MPDLGIDPAVFLRLFGGGGIFVWALLWLIRRGDGLQRENITELRRQRDFYRKRAEVAEAERDVLRARLADRMDTGELPVIRRKEQP